MSSRLSGIVSVVALSLTVLLIFYIVFRPAPKIAYVNSGKLIDAYQGMIDARKAYQKKATVWEANIDSLKSELERKMAQYEKESLKMTVKEKDLFREIIRGKQQELQNYQQAMEAQARQEDATMTSSVVSQMNAYIEAYGKKQNYTIILSTSNGSIVYAEHALDITETVLTGLNAQYKGND